MAATARRRGDADEDIAAIAKQISEQAEAIYQNWKSRGLGPADLISCHSVGDTTKLGSMLKPQPPTKPSIELLAQAPTMDNNRLEKLVKNFVVEDKARIAAAAAAAASNTNNKPMPSSIQYALRKFEKNTPVPQPQQLTSTNGDSSEGVMLRRTTPRTSWKQQQLDEGSRENGGGNGGACRVEGSSGLKNGLMSPQSPLGPKPAISQKPLILSPKPRFLSDTIEMTLPPDHQLSQLQSWPLKNRVISTDNVKKTIAEVKPQGPLSPGGTTTTTTATTGRLSPSTVGQPLSPRNSYIDEVDLEEKRLINALKNGEPNEILFNGEKKGISSTHTTSIITTTSICSPPHDHSSSRITTPTSLISSATTTMGVSVLRSGTDLTGTTIVPTTTKWGVRTGGVPRRPPPEQVVPHPELTTSQRLHLRQSAANPVRPFLTRGSVAERVLIFERCPSDLLLDKRVLRASVGSGTGAGLGGMSGGGSKPQLLAKNSLSNNNSGILPHTTLQRHVRGATRSSAAAPVHIPRFYYPSGKPPAPGTAQSDGIQVRVQAAFVGIGERAAREHFATLATAVQVPLYWKTSLYLAACADKGGCTLDGFMAFWASMTATCHDASSRFVYILTRGRRTWLCSEDLIPLVQDVVETHPGLTFLKEATEFHSRYVHTVIARIFYCVNRSWSGRITIPELRRSNLLSVIQMLDEEEDINQVTQYFSYEHFYVIYCKFWELDRDHDLYIDKQDMTRHNDHALSKRIIDRIFSGCVTRGQRKSAHDEKLSYCEFVWFLLSEEDKRHPTAIEYWFRCMDLDGDGFLSMYELEYFYEEQMHRMEMIGIETLPFEDCLCQMLDMVKPEIPGKISLSDLKKCKMTPIFFDSFFNLEKYMDHEQRDPFASQRDHDIDGQELSDWDKFAAEEYELLVAEEGGTDDPNSLSFDEGNEDDDLISQNLDVVLDISEPQGDGAGVSAVHHSDDDEDSDECSI